MFVLYRNVINGNEVLSNIEKEFSVFKKLTNIFVLYFDEVGQLNITHTRDGFYFEQLSEDDLKQLSQYFFQVAILKHNLDKN